MRVSRALLAQVGRLQSPSPEVMFIDQAAQARRLFRDVSCGCWQTLLFA